MMVNIFYSIVDEIIVTNVPLKRTRVNSFPVWFSREIRICISDKVKAHTRFKVSNLDRDYIEFKRLRARCLRLRKLCYSDYIAKIEKACRSDVESFWSYVNSQRGNKNIPNTMSYHNETVFGDSDVANLFVLYFSTFYNVQIPLFTNCTFQKVILLLH